ncbi:MAG: sensor histidine kinase N-terminal domain-containing protein [Sphingomonadaceae bacterium]|nr:sensor histidine kinase N-terminal domain-containing protein [Sphingomonadaceae bacterium]MCP5384739.1 sensor histidine kinase N-terminal domain-containing protein [Altererythrobacter sp.]MCP5393934.1 sensor histidine kinase N-terminal domain-containing protein [Sphingomonadaceae bacterium]
MNASGAVKAGGETPAALRDDAEAATLNAEIAGGAAPPHTGSLSRRMMAIAAGWILILLLAGGFALDRVLTNLVEKNFDDQLEYLLNAMLVTAEIGPDGEVYFNRPIGEPRFLEPNSGLYFQISSPGKEGYLSRSLWDAPLQVEDEHVDMEPHFYNSNQIEGEPLRIVERSVVLPDDDTQWTFAVASAREELDYQIARIRSILLWSFAVLAFGLIMMAALQSWYGLRPLRRIRMAIQKIRTTGVNRVTDPLPLEVQPLVEELNMLLAHSEKQAEEARMHAGNLAHALKTPLTVLTNAATARDPKLASHVFRETKVMQRHVDHHLARARAVGRRATGLSRAAVWPSAESVLRAVTRIYESTRFDLDGNREAQVAIERQDLDEILGNLIENAAKYGGGSVFVTVDADRDDSERCEIWIEDDGMGIPREKYEEIFDRGARLDTGKPGTGLGLAIVRDVAEIYGGRVTLDESEDLGGLLVRLNLPRAG